MDPKILSAHGKFRRTNSKVKGFHSFFGKRIGRKHPNCCIFKAEKCWKGLSIGGKSFEGGRINKKVPEKNVKLLINSLSKLSKNW